MEGNAQLILFEQESKRRCPQCKEEKILSTKYFGKDSSNKHGFRYECKLCSRNIWKKYKEKDGNREKLNQKWNDRYRKEQSLRYKYPEGLIYFIQNIETKSIKIGWAKQSPKGRMKKLQTGNESILKLIGLLPGDIGKEQQIQTKFYSTRKYREWFHYSDELKDYIEKYAQDNKDYNIESMATI
jgi:predicted RNA-binding Zn-ribbon protein involved in translation (DUF1610 family)|tara:strand:- start:8398 stop:8949 length:552 start_codon:yes stop_codon:yes gene_type:complete